MKRRSSNPVPTLLIIICDLAGFAGGWLLTWRVRQLLNAHFPNPINEIDPYIASLKFLLPAISCWSPTFSFCTKLYTPTAPRGISSMPDPYFLASSS